MEEFESKGGQKNFTGVLSAGLNVDDSYIEV
jgi:hypothetical protein